MKIILRIVYNFFLLLLLHQSLFAQCSSRVYHLDSILMNRNVENTRYIEQLKHTISFAASLDTCTKTNSDGDIIIYYQERLYGYDAHANSYLIKYSNDTLLSVQEKHWTEYRGATMPNCYFYPDSQKKIKIQDLISNLQQSFVISSGKDDIKNLFFMSITIRDKNKNILGVFMGQGNQESCFFAQKTSLSNNIQSIINWFRKLE